MSTLVLSSAPQTLTFSKAVRQHLNANRNEYNADLIDAYLKDAPFIETQVNIRTDIGEPRSRKLPNGRTINYRVDGNTAFANIRYPRQAATAPQWDDGRDQRWPIPTYAEGIGTTWFAQEGSRRLGYDVDSLWGHKGKRALTDGELGDIRRAIERVPYAEVRRSTSGRGFHLYLLLDGIEVANHTEHAGLARALLGMFCNDAGLDFAPKLIAWAEICGSGAGGRPWRIEVLSG